MNSAETIERVPIHTDADGVVRVAGTRVTLDTIVGAFDTGATAEDIAQQYLLRAVGRRVLRDHVLNERYVGLRGHRVARATRS